MTPLTALLSLFLIVGTILVDLLALFLAITTVSILWYLVKKIFPDDVKDLQFFLTFIVAVVPFVIVVWLGMAVTSYDAITARSGWPPVLPLNGLLSAPTVGAGRRPDRLARGHSEKPKEFYELRRAALSSTALCRSVLALSAQRPLGLPRRSSAACNAGGRRMTDRNEPINPDGADGAAELVGITLSSITTPDHWDKTPEQKLALEALYGDGGLASWQRVLAIASPENRADILQNALIELYHLAAKAGADDTVFRTGALASVSCITLVLTPMACRRLLPKQKTELKKPRATKPSPS
jgi:hypothetical protein